MKMLRFGVNIPDEIDANLAASECLKMCDWVIGQLARDARDRSRRDTEKRAILSDDRALKHFIRRNGAKAIVRAQIYRNAEIRHYQEFPEFHYERDPRRPVFMRGSVASLIQRHSHGHYHTTCPNGWCFAVLERYLARYKIICVKNHEFNEWVAPVVSALKQRHRGTSWHFDRWVDTLRPRRDHEVLFHGRLIDGIKQNNQGNIRKLIRLRKRLDRLDAERGKASEDAA